MINNEAYWISIAHLPGWRNKRINELIVKFHHEQKTGIEGFFSLDASEWKKSYDLNDKETEDLLNAKSEISNNSFLAESLYNQGYEIIPLISPEYSQTLKNNLKTNYSPPVLYVKGNKDILKEKSIAIVGSRNAGEISLQFTDNVAKNASGDYKVVVSGFAKGVDKQALDSAIAYKGQSIIVLPQGITTFGSGFKTYYRQLVDGDVLVLSTFHPRVPWRTDLAMARNTVIYGLADEIYVAESSDSGGTWSGVRDGIRKHRVIFVRQPEQGEKNANLLLIRMGAVPVDIYGRIITSDYSIHTDIKEQGVAEESEKTIRDIIKSLLEKGPLSADQIKEQTGTSWTKTTLSGYLKKLDFVEVLKVRNKNFYFLKEVSEKTEPKLF